GMQLFTKMQRFEEPKGRHHTLRIFTRDSEFHRFMGADSDKYGLISFFEKAVNGNIFPECGICLEFYPCVSHEIYVDIKGLAGQAVFRYRYSEHATHHGFCLKDRYIISL